MSSKYLSTSESSWTTNSWSSPTIAIDTFYRNRIFGLYWQKTLAIQFILRKDAAGWKALKLLPCLLSLLRLVRYHVMLVIRAQLRILGHNLLAHLCFSPNMFWQTGSELQWTLLCSHKSWLMGIPKLPHFMSGILPHSTKFEAKETLTRSMKTKLVLPDICVAQDHHSRPLIVQRHMVFCCNLECITASYFPSPT